MRRNNETMLVTYRLWCVERHANVIIARKEKRLTAILNGLFYSLTFECECLLALGLLPDRNLPSQLQQDIGIAATEMFRE